jgi:hypothetical protein
MSGPKCSAKGLAFRASTKSRWTIFYRTSAAKLHFGYMRSTELFENYAGNKFLS